MWLWGPAFRRARGQVPNGDQDLPVVARIRISYCYRFSDGARADRSHSHLPPSQSQPPAATTRPTGSPQAAGRQSRSRSARMPLHRARQRRRNGAPILLASQAATQAGNRQSLVSCGHSAPEPSSAAKPPTPPLCRHSRIVRRVWVASGAQHYRPPQRGSADGRKGRATHL